MDSPFLDLPITIREQIYHELLTYPASNTTPEDTAPSSPICRLLTLNHQIHGEITQFLKSQLCILINTNDEKFLRDILREKHHHLPLISQLRSQDGTINKDIGKVPIAVEVDFYMFRNSLEAVSSAAFLIPATSIKTLSSTLGRLHWLHW
jgi:hypothetical protein